MILNFIIGGAMLALFVMAIIVMQAATEIKTIAQKINYYTPI